MRRQTVATGPVTVARALQVSGPVDTVDLKAGAGLEEGDGVAGQRPEVSVGLQRGQLGDRGVQLALQVGDGRRLGADGE
ncbi:hypothetical protein OHV05_37630 (plasmid) [Kitasatospora sp. NBC_00070]